MIASRAFHDQDVDVFFRERRRLHNCLIVEIHVARVKDGSAFGAKKNSRRAKDVSCVEKLERQRVSFALWCPLAGNGDPLAQRAPAPTLRCPVRFTMREKWIRHFSDLFALARHHVDRVVQKHTADLCRGLRHEHARAWKAPHRHRQRADMILMRVRNEDRFNPAIRDCLQLRQCVLPSILWMHSTVEQ